MVASLQSTRSQLLDRAARIVDTEGFAALSVRRLAAELNASRQVVYTHFGGMNGLLDALHMRSSDLLAGDVSALEAPPGTDENLLAGARSYVTAARSRPAMFDLTFARPVPDYTPSAQATQHARDVFLHHIVGIVDAWLERNAPCHTESESIELARVFWSAIHGLVILERAGHARRDETDKLVAQTVSLLFDGRRSQVGSTP